MKELKVSKGSRRMRSGQATVWIIIIIAILVVIGVIWWSNRRTNNIRQQGEEQVTTLQRQIRGAEARARLAALKANILAGQAADELENQYDDIRAALEEDYAGARGAAQETWDAIRGDLDTLGEQIRNESGEATATIDGIIDRMRQ